MFGRTFISVLSGKFGIAVQSQYHKMSEAFLASFALIFATAHISTILVAGDTANFQCDSKRLNVTLKVRIFSILDVHEASETVALKMSLQMVWRDESLAWPLPQHFGNLTDDEQASVITRRFAEVDSICTPDITIEESVRPYVFPPKDQRLFVRITHDGVVNSYFPHTSYISCKMDVALYPFDKQLCTLRLWTVAKTHNEVELHYVNTSLTAYTFRDNKEWRMQDASVTRHVSALSSYSYAAALVERTGDQLSNMIEYKFWLARKPLYYVMNMVYPSTLVAWVSVVGAFTASGSGPMRHEKVRLGIAALLSTSVQMLLVSEKIPVTSDHVPVLNLYYVILTVTQGVTTLVTAVLLQTHSTGAIYGTPVPSALGWSCRLLARLLLMSHAYDVLKDRSREPKERAREWDAVTSVLERACLIIFSLIIFGNSIHLTSYSYFHQIETTT